MVVFGQKWFYSGNKVVFGHCKVVVVVLIRRAKVVVLGQSCCIRAKVVVFGQSGFGCIGAKVVVFEQRWLYLGKSGCTPESGCIFSKWLYSGKLVIFGQKWLYSGQTGFLRRKWMCSGKGGCIPGKVVLFG